MAARQEMVAGRQEDRDGEAKEGEGKDGECADSSGEAERRAAYTSPLSAQGPSTRRMRVRPNAVSPSMRMRTSSNAHGSADALSSTATPSRALPAHPAARGIRTPLLIIALLVIALLVIPRARR